MTIETKPLDPTVYLDRPNGMLARLNGGLASGDAGEIADARDVVARALGLRRYPEPARVG